MASCLFDLLSILASADLTICACSSSEESDEGADVTGEGGRVEFSGGTYSPMSPAPSSSQSKSVKSESSLQGVDGVVKLSTKSMNCERTSSVDTCAKGKLSRNKNACD